MPPDPLENYPACSSCRSPMWPGDTYCADCGQRVYPGPPGFWQMLGSFFNTVFDLDNRLFRTLGALVVPGRLTRYFLTGRQRPYFHPLRLFFVSGVLVVGAYTFVVTEAIGDSLEESQEESRESAYGTIYALRLREAVDSVLRIYPDTAVVAATDSIQQLLANRQGDSITLAYLEYRGGLSLQPLPVTMAQKDFLLRMPDQLLDNYEVEGWANRYQIRQIIRLSRIGVQGVAALMGQLIWGLMLLVPLVALWLKLLYVRRNRRYVEHFVFGLHVHAFLFLLQFLAALELYFFDSTYLLVGSGVFVVIYTVVALRRVYGQGWLKTLLKAVALFWGHVFLFGFVVALTAIVAAAFF